MVTLLLMVVVDRTRVDCSLFARCHRRLFETAAAVFVGSIVIVVVGCFGHRRLRRRRRWWGSFHGGKVIREH